MSQIRCYEMSDSMSGSVTNEQESGEQREVRRRYVIGQCVGFNDAVEQITRYAPEYVEADGAGIYWVRRRLDVNGIGNRWFDCTAVYQTLLPKIRDGKDDDNGGDFVPGSIAWDTTGHMEHITTSRGAPERSFPEGAATFKGAINVSGETVQGMDIVAPGMRYSETWILAVSVAMDHAYVGHVNRLTGSTNLNPFRAFDRGECLFLGARAQWTGDVPYVAVTFEFEARKNNDAFNVPFIASFSKKGWEHVWIRYQDGVNKDVLVKDPVACYVDTPYIEMDWSPLRLTAKEPGKKRSGTAPETPEQEAR